MKKLSKKNNPDQEKNKFQKANEKIDAGKKLSEESVFWQVLQS